MAGDKDTRSEQDSRSLAADLLRRATSPEVLAGVAGAAAAARFTKHMVEDSDEDDPEEPPEAEETDEADPSGEDEPDDDEPDDDDDEEEEVPEGATQPESDDDDDDEEAEASQDEDTQEPEESEEESDPSDAANGSFGTEDERMELLDQARRYAEQLTGHQVESFSSLEQDDRGWRIGLEVVELSRVPSTTDVLGSYELVLSDDGEFVDFRRAHRYYRNSTDDAS